MVKIKCGNVLQKPCVTSMFFYFCVESLKSSNSAEQASPFFSGYCVFQIVVMT